ncbi:MAG: hypothetical protein LBC64_11110 [Fibromonadaceae bacterium]|jgi:flagellin|nr:hypothetical protein [Fibromonadaceae bacterium]
MQINHNIRAMVTQHAVYSSNNSMSKSLEKLSTGLKINRAQDDAAGLAMSEQMRTQIRGLGKAKQNSQDSIAALQIAEGGLQEITNLMQRQRELAVQSANDTLTSTERKYLNDEFKELTNEVARISRTTDYNGKNMLNWSDDPNKSFGAIGQAKSGDLLNQLTQEAADLAKKAGNVSVPGATDADLTAMITNMNTAIAALNTFLSSETGDGGALKTLWDAVKEFKGQADAAVSNNNISARDKDIFMTIADRLYGVGSMRSDVITEANGYTGTGVSANEDSNTSPLTSMAELYVAALKIGDDKYSKASSYTLHIGANYSVGVAGKWGNEMTVTYLSVSPGALGLNQRDIKTQNNATDAIDQLDKVIKSVSGARAKIGTFINRLEYTINNIASLEFNTQDAESRIRDTDFSKETTSFTRNQIMVQSGVSMLAQANSLPQAVLGLLG